MLFSLHLRAYKLNFYLTISCFETKMHTFKKKITPKRNTKQLLKYAQEGRGVLETGFVYALTMKKGLLP